MTVLLDTNVLLRNAEPGHPQHQLATSACIALRSRGDALGTVPQCHYEFWVVATRSLAHNGLGWTTSATAAELRRIDELFPVIQDTPDIYQQWQALVTGHDLKGKVAHDARLVAAMLVHGIHALLTFNEQDLARFPEIEVISPASTVTRS